MQSRGITVAEGDAQTAGQGGNAGKPQAAADLQGLQSGCPGFAQNGLGQHPRRRPQVGPVGQIPFGSEHRTHAGMFEHAVRFVRTRDDKGPSLDEDLLTHQLVDGLHGRLKHGSDRYSSYNFRTHPTSSACVRGRSAGNKR